MSEDALPRLVAAHPLLFRGDPPPYSHLPSGWFALADRLCRDLEGTLGDQVARWSVVQSKEKFGSWRLYWQLEGVVHPTHADVLGSVAANPEVSRVQDEPGSEIHVAPTPAGVRLSILGDDKLSRAIHERVRQAELESEATCLFCGAPGTLWMDGWLHTACDAHKRPKAMSPEMWQRTREDGLRTRKGQKADDDNQ